MDEADYTSPVPNPTVPRIKPVLLVIAVWTALVMHYSAKIVLYLYISSIPCIVLRYGAVFKQKLLKLLFNL